MSNGGNMERVLRLMAEKNASDVYLSAHAPATIRINGVSMPINNQVLPPEATLFLDTWMQFCRLSLDKLLLVLHFKTKRRIFQPLLARHLKAGFTSAQNIPCIVIPQIKTNIRKDRNINRLPIHYASTTLASC